MRNTIGRWASGRLTIAAIAVAACLSGSRAAPAGAANDISIVHRDGIRLIVMQKVATNGRVGSSPAAVLSSVLAPKDLLSSNVLAPRVVSATVTQHGLAALSEHIDDVALFRDTLAKPSLQRSIPLIHADQLHRQGMAGAGVAVAILDTGVASSHPALHARIQREACFSSNDAASHSQSLCPGGAGAAYGPNTARPCGLEGCEHGTHVAGIAASGGSIYQGKPISGVAEAANIIAVQVYSEITDPATCGSPHPCVLSWASDQIRALEYVKSLADAGVRIAAANLSLGLGDSNQDACDGNPLKPTIDRLRAEGILTVIAAGNDGHAEGISSPACISSAVSVGALDEEGAQINLASFSDRSKELTIVAQGRGSYRLGLTEVIARTMAPRWPRPSSAELSRFFVRSSLAVASTISRAH